MAVVELEFRADTANATSLYAASLRLPKEYKGQHAVPKGELLESEMKQEREERLPNACGGASRMSDRLPNKSGRLT